MTHIEYMLYAIRMGYLKKLDWYYSVMGLPTDDTYENKYITYHDNKYTVKLENGESIQITNSLKDRPLLVIPDEVILTEEHMSNVKGTVVTNFGKVIANYVLLVDCFDYKIPYMEDEVTIKRIEAIIKDLLTDDKTSETNITVKEYVKFADNALFLTNLSRLVSISSTYKGVIPPPGINEYKAKLIKEFKEKYGDNVFEDYTKVSELETLLKKYDDEWLKDDPSYGKLLSGKMKNTSRAKLYLTYGAEVAFDKSGKAKLVTNSLDDGWPTSKEELANMYNASRAGSYDRGAETQNGGVIAKTILRATNSIKIKPGDCGTKLGKLISINKDNLKSLLGRQMMISGKLIKLDKDNQDKYLGKDVIFRSPAYCRTKDNNICSVCAGEQLTDYKEAVSLLVLQIGSTILYISMASMHGASLTTRKYNLDDALS